MYGTPVDRGGQRRGRGSASDVETREGKRYDNGYCMIFTLRDGKIAEVVEYMDTELAAAVLGARVL